MQATGSLPQTLTPFHAKYYAYELTRRCPPDSDDRLASALVDAQVDLNPHQIDAALFSFKSPLSRGVLLADEVGLGKTIEAGLVLAQRWAERKRRVLVITPSNLRKQWHQELTDKFFLPCRILEAKSYNDAIKAGQFSPFETDGHVVICSYQFARNKAADVHKTAWDLVVMDEAHRLRNVYKPSNVIANTLKQALASAPKLLLTATPLQNSLLELFGLVSIIDDQVFGDLKSFREQFSDLTQEQVFATLKRRLAPLCHRTLRRQVTAYVSYTRRLPLVEQFTPDASEDRLYDLVSEYLRRDNLKGLPSGQRTLMTLVMRKLLASSSFAIAGALNTLAKRLRGTLAKQTAKESSPDELLVELDEDYEALDQTAEEWEDEDLGPPLSAEDREALALEIADLEQFRDLAASITHNAKGEALLKALRVAFDKATELGGAKKAIIFTESRKTQLYLQRLLADSPWKDGLVLFNGSNTDQQSRAIYAEWRARHEGTDQITGSKTADMRSAIVDYFRDQGQIMIATEAGAEGINLQFCSLVVNYDLPWNPQRIEQRIGRCHRYGQKHDVVVVNFLNGTNAADQRVFQLLSEKFKLFEGVFGASDEVLGAIESGVDFEKRIGSIYQQCRRTDEIKTAFDALQQELDFEITGTFDKARQQLLEHFGDEVREKLRVRNESSRASLNRYEQRLMALMGIDPRDHNDARDDERDAIYDPRWRTEGRERYEIDDRERDALDAFARGVDLPRGPERELAQDSRERLCELNGDDSRMLATIGAFRVVSERDLDGFRGARESVEHLRDEKLIRSVPIGHDEKAVVLTDRGWDVLKAHRLDRDHTQRQEFHAGVSRPRELRHDAQLFGAYREVEKRLHEKGARVERLVLEVDLKREYQQFLQEHNRHRSDSDGHPDRDERESESWARDHCLPYFDDQVHFPDFRIEYELDGQERHEDVEVVTDNYRGAHAASRVRAGFTCVGSSKRGGGPVRPREWDWL